MALPICKGGADLYEDVEKWENLLEKLDEKLEYKTPFLTGLIKLISLYIKWGIMTIIVTIIFYVIPLYEILNFIFQGNVIKVMLVYEAIKLLTSVVALVFVLVFVKKAKRNYYEREKEKAEKKWDEHFEKYNCAEMFYVPKKYFWDYDAMRFFFEALAKNNADTLDEAVHQYERKLANDRKK